MKRRQYGSGSVFQRSRDGRWVGSFAAGWTETGARRRVTVVAKTKAEVNRKLRDRIREYERDRTAPATRATVKSWSDHWLEDQSHRLSPNGLKAASSAVRKWIVPTIGHRRLADLTPADVRAVTTAIRQAGRSSTTGQRVHSTLLNMVRAAKRDGHPVHDRVLTVRPPKKAISDRATIDEGTARLLLTVARATLPHWSRWYVAVGLGMRQGECLGLTWDSVDLTREQLTVEWQLQRLPHLDRRDKGRGFRIPDGYETRHLEGRYHLVRPKSEHGYRVVPLFSHMATALRDWREVSPESPHGLVWPACDGGPTDPAVDFEEWCALQCTAGIGHPAGRYYYTHECRHGMATRLQEVQANATTILRILGHSSLAVSQGYMHENLDPARAAIERIGEMLALPEQD